MASGTRRAVPTILIGRASRSDAVAASMASAIAGWSSTTASAMPVSGGSAGWSTAPSSQATPPHSLREIADCADRTGSGLIAAMRRTALLAAVAIAIGLAGCLATTRAGVVDGWPVGGEYVCAVDRCQRYVEVAATALDDRDPGHAVIVRATLHDLGTAIGDDGQPEVLVFSGGPPTVVLFELADGTARAIGVKMVLNGPEIFSSAWGPELDWEAPPGR